MSFLFVSENYDNNSNILYIRESLSELFFKNGADKITADRHRVGMLLSVDEQVYKAANEELADKIADVIAVGYKFNFFNEQIKTAGLNKLSREFLICSLISADLDEDKRYIRSKFRESKECAIDGLFNFKLGNLKSKWNEIANYIPTTFSQNELKEFIVYVTGEKKGRAVTVDGERVYDKKFNRLKRVNLLPADNRCRVTKEVLLSGAGEVLVKKVPLYEDESYLKEFFGDKISFKEL
ncbi:MAG: hypothetical protein IJW13_06515 [Clostridia bacterium]|nr:hypothetical protein [Clostridia bacterium]